MAGVHKGQAVDIVPPVFGIEPHFILDEDRLSSSEENTKAA